MSSNPLLAPTDFPRFSAIRPEHVEPAVDALLAACREGVTERLAAGRPSWQGLIEPLELLENRLNNAWSPVGHMNAVVNSDALRAAYNACLPKLSAYATEMGQNRSLCDAYRRIRDHQPDLDDAQRRALDNALRDFHLSGVDLPPDQQARFKEISQALSRLTSRYEENLLDATNAWSKRLDDEAALAGLPDSARALARQTARERGLDGFVLTLEFPSYLPVMTHADDRALRRELYEAYATRASDQGPHAGRWDNGELMEEILRLRHEKARLLGFDHYTAYSLATKMAPSPDAVLEFLHDLAARSRPQAQRELAELEAFARARFGVDLLEAWDIPYYAEKLRQERFRISDEELRPYFPETRVVPGLFEVVRRLFGIEIREQQEFDRYHPDVRLFHLQDPQGERLGSFYLDLYARPKKRGGAWMDGAQNRLVNDALTQLPVAFLTCNFSPPVDGRPALFTHDEVETLFHEFGHGLHHLLTRIDYPPVAGINGVPWDAVELPSQLLENWCWEREALDLISGHVDSGAPMPDDLYQRMRAAKNFQSAMQMVRQLEFALFDFRLHGEYDPGQGGRIYAILAQVRAEVAVVRPPAWNRFAHGFSHIFAGGYAAGYYSYKWAEVLSADAFSLFEENGVFDPESGRRLRDTVLAQGGSRDAMELYVAFRGREPRIDALLRHSGIAG